MPSKVEEKVQQIVVKPQVIEAPSAEVVVKTASKPLSKSRISSGININSLMNSDDSSKGEEIIVVKNESSQEHHFTETDVQSEWNLLLLQLRTKDPVIYSAIKSFKLQKIDEKTIQIQYPSGSAKVEFDKISSEFFNHFKTKVNNHSIVFDFKHEPQNLRQEVLTTKKKFEKLVEINPLLKDLDDLMKFDLT
ncbi:hypothetical protein [Chryseobacterium aquaeductus]|uniref:hypothetical protein n=1 Tax=Chryseobacterium aquaeductus TaxID=2675056 RepID=UPI001389BCC9|nr:hypothetical protein [Chryseobacterium aquaeductus]